MGQNGNVVREITSTVKGATLRKNGYNLPNRHCGINLKEGET